MCKQTLTVNFRYEINLPVIFQKPPTFQTLVLIVCFLLLQGSYLFLPIDLPDLPSSLSQVVIDVPVLFSAFLVLFVLYFHPQVIYFKYMY